MMQISWRPPPRRFLFLVFLFVLIAFLLFGFGRLARNARNNNSYGVRQSICGNVHMITDKSSGLGMGFGTH